MKRAMAIIYARMADKTSLLDTIIKDSQVRRSVRCADQMDEFEIIQHTTI
jgi:uncharacterized protein (UPF0147 family)